MGAPTSFNKSRRRTVVLAPCCAEGLQAWWPLPCLEGVSSAAQAAATGARAAAASAASTLAGKALATCAPGLSASDFADVAATASETAAMALPPALVRALSSGAAADQARGADAVLVADKVGTARVWLEEPTVLAMADNAAVLTEAHSAPLPPTAGKLDGDTANKDAVMPVASVASSEVAPASARLTAAGAASALAVARPALASPTAGSEPASNVAPPLAQLCGTLAEGAASELRGGGRRSTDVMQRVARIESAQIGGAPCRKVLPVLQRVAQIESAQIGGAASRKATLASRASTPRLMQLRSRRYVMGLVGELECLQSQKAHKGRARTPSRLEMSGASIIKRSYTPKRTSMRATL